MKRSIWSFFVHQVVRLVGWRRRELQQRGKVNQVSQVLLSFTCSMLEVNLGNALDFLVDKLLADKPRS